MMGSMTCVPRVQTSARTLTTTYARNSAAWCTSMKTVRQAKRDRGFTIVELLVTMAVILMITVAAAMSLGVLFRADLKTSGGQLSASVRYLYSLSVLNNQSYRLVIDMETGDTVRKKGPEKVGPAMYSSSIRRGRNPYRMRRVGRRKESLLNSVKGKSSLVVGSKS